MKGQVTPLSTQELPAFEEPLHTRGGVAAWWRSWYRLLRLVGRPLMWLTRRHGFGNLVVLHVVGRRSGRDRSLPLGLLTVGDGRYVGHPSGDTGWTLNLRAAESVEIEGARLGQHRVRAVVLSRGAERDAVVRATFRQHPFPGNALYRLAGRHVFENGVFFRLESATTPDR
jgi:hypothetical protein